MHSPQFFGPLFLISLDLPVNFLILSTLRVDSFWHFECRFSARWLGIVPWICSVCNRGQVCVLFDHHSAHLTVQKLTFWTLEKNEQPMTPFHHEPIINEVRNL